MQSIFCAIYFWHFCTFLPFLCLLQVFLTECAGPLIIYLMFYFRLPFIYPPKYDFTSSKHWVVQWVSACSCFQGSVVMLVFHTIPGFAQMFPEHDKQPRSILLCWQRVRAMRNELQRGNVLIRAKYCTCVCVLLQLGLHVSLLPLHQEDSGDPVCASYLPWDHASQKYI